MRRIIINGSFITDLPEPNDVDIVVLTGPAFGAGRELKQAWEAGLPFLHIELADQSVLHGYVREIFAFDRYGNPKGMLEVPL